MTDYEAAFWKLKNNWHESVAHYEDRIEKLEAENEELQSKVGTVRLAAKYAAKIRDDRIEKLEAALREIDEWAEEQCYVGLRKLIRKALEGEND